MTFNNGYLSRELQWKVEAHIRSNHESIARETVGRDPANSRTQMYEFLHLEKVYAASMADLVKFGVRYCAEEGLPFDAAAGKVRESCCALLADARVYGVARETAAAAFGRSATINTYRTSAVAALEKELDHLMEGAAHGRVHGEKIATASTAAVLAEVATALAALASQGEKVANLEQKLAEYQKGLETATSPEKQESLRQKLVDALKDFGTDALIKLIRAAADPKMEELIRKITT